jgi:hypothetical protein
LNDKVNSENKQTADNSRKKIGICDIPFDHNSSLLLIRSNERTINKNAEIKAAIKERGKAGIFCGGINNGEITPIVNQATAMLPEISANFSNWPADNFIISDRLT